MSDTKYGPKQPTGIPAIGGDANTKTGVMTLPVSEMAFGSMQDGRNFGTDVFAYGAPSAPSDHLPWAPDVPWNPLDTQPVEVIPSLQPVDAAEPGITRREFLLAIESLKAAFREMEDEYRRSREAATTAPTREKEFIGYRAFVTYACSDKVDNVVFFDVRVHGALTQSRAVHYVSDLRILGHACKLFRVFKVKK